MLSYWNAAGPVCVIPLQIRKGQSEYINISFLPSKGNLIELNVSGSFLYSPTRSRTAHFKLFERFGSWNRHKQLECAFAGADVAMKKKGSAPTDFKYPSYVQDIMG